MLLFILILLLLIPFFIIKNKNKHRNEIDKPETLLLTKNLLPNNNVENVIKDKLKVLLRKRFPGCKRIEFLNIFVEEREYESFVSVEIRFTFKNNNSFNTIVTKVQIEAIYLHGPEQVLVKNLILNTGCIDIGAIVPENTDKYFDDNFVNRSWKNTKKKLKEKQSWI